MALARRPSVTGGIGDTTHDAAVLPRTRGRTWRNHAKIGSRCCGSLGARPRQRAGACALDHAREQRLGPGERHARQRTGHHAAQRDLFGRRRRRPGRTPTARSAAAPARSSPRARRTTRSRPTTRRTPRTSNNLGGDPLCNAMIPGFMSFDATKLTIVFELAPGFTGISFKSVFGSEEYPEYVNTAYNDVYGAYLDGVQVAFDANGNPITINGPILQQRERRGAPGERHGIRRLDRPAHHPRDDQPRRPHAHARDLRRRRPQLRQRRVHHRPQRLRRQRLHGHRAVRLHRQRRRRRQLLRRLRRRERRTPSRARPRPAIRSTTTATVRSTRATSAARIRTATASATATTTA